MDRFDPRLGRVVSDNTEAATDKHDLYSSPHEGYAVIREEYKELKTEMKEFKDDFDALDYFIRHDADLIIQMKNIRRMRDHAKAAIMEAVDLMVTIDRYIMSCCVMSGVMHSHKDGSYSMDADDEVRAAFTPFIRDMIRVYEEEDNTYPMKCLATDAGGTE